MSGGPGVLGLQGIRDQCPRVEQELDKCLERHEKEFSKYCTNVVEIWKECLRKERIRRQIVSR